MRWVTRWIGEDRTDPSVRADTSRRATAESLLASLLTMAWVVEARDPYTGGHLWRVSRYAWLVAQAMGLPPADVARCSLGGFLHDLGKVAVPDAILRKAGALTTGEYAVIQTHPTMGVRMLAGHPLATLVRDAVGLHHERPDGRGYPRGLAADDIPLEARVVGVCDAFDAMTSHRPYRVGMPRDEALAQVRMMRGRQFDPAAAEALLSLDTATLDHVIGHSDDGIPLQNCPMCGPTLALRRDHCAGEHLYCRNCTGEFELQSGPAGLMAVPTGRQGTAAQLVPEVNEALIEQTVHTIVAALPVSELVAH